jgi:hypothetical protein
LSVLLPFILAAYTGYNAIVFQHPAKLPRTITVLAELAESRLDFALRRIEWTAAEFSRAGHSPTRWQLIRGSGTDRVKTWPEVQQALDIAVAWLLESGSTGPASTPPMTVRDRLIAKISALLCQFEAEQPEP